MSNRSFILEWESGYKGMGARGIVLFLMFLAALSGRSWGIDNPVGRGTVPASSGIGSERVPGGIYRGGLVRSPNPLDGSGNLTVTGNVRGGRHFRGIVPYQSRYSFEADLPSSSLDSFLRYSAGSEDIGGGAGRYETQPYYSGTRTVTTAGPSDEVIFRPASTRIDDRASPPWRVLLPPSLGEVPAREDVVVPYTSIKLRPLSMSPLELERVILEEIETLGPGTISESKKLADEWHRPPLRLPVGRQEQGLLQDTRTVSDKAAELKRSLLVEDGLSFDFAQDGEPVEPLRLPTKTESGEEEREKLEPRFLLSQESSGVGVGFPQSGVPPDAQVDVYEQMKWQINNIQRDIESASGGLGAKQTLPPRLATRVAEAGKKVKATDKAKRDVDTHASDRRDEEELFFWVTECKREEGDKEDRRQKTDDRGQKSDIRLLTSDSTDVSAKAREILGEHKTFASFAEDKFNRHMRAAEEYLKRGRYYRAADAYTLAAIYKPDDPLAYAGKSHALFAAGEYMSSALFLARTLEIFPEYAQFKIDLVAMVGDKDKLESRIANVEEWLDESNAAELQFLLGYVYYQMGRQEEAEKMVYAAFAKMPESPAVAALKKAVTGAAE